jgi:UDP-glucose 4-epimerase
VNVLVTGGAGFIGANLCRRLSAMSGFGRIVALDDLSTGRRENLDDVASVELLEGSVLDEHLLAAAFESADAVVHLAALPSVPRSIEDPVGTYRANVTGTLNVLEAARRAGGTFVVVASSSSVYGANPALPKREDMAPMPASPYAASKVAAEAYALSYARAFDLPVLAVRLFNVFGPLQPAGHAYAAVVPSFVSCALRDEPLPVHGDGLQTRDFTYVGSVTGVIAEALRRRVTDAAPVNLAFGSRVSLLELIGTLEEVLESPLRRVHLAARPGDVRDSCADTSRLELLFPGVRPTGLAEGLRETAGWIGGRLGVGIPS